MKPTYDDTAMVTSILGFGNRTISAVIVDEMSLPSCVDVIVNVNQVPQLTNSNQSISIHNLTLTLTNVYSDLITDEQTSAVSILLVNEAIYQSLVDSLQFISSEAMTNEEYIVLWEFQEKLVLDYIRSVQRQIENGTFYGVQDVYQTLSVLAVITVPGIDISNETIFNNTINETLVQEILDFVAYDLVSILQTNGDIVILNRDTVQFIFGMCIDSFRLVSFKM